MINRVFYNYKSMHAIALLFMLNSRNKILIVHDEFKKDYFSRQMSPHSKQNMSSVRISHNVSILMIDATKVMRLFMILLVSLQKNA